MTIIIFFIYKKRKYDLAFSGVLQNSRKNEVQSDVRIRILNRLYFTIFNIPLYKRKNINTYQYIGIQFQQLF